MQNYKNHIRYYPFHHFVITPLTLVYLIWTIVNVVKALGSGFGVNDQLYHLIGAIILFLLPLLARIYALKNQDRIIRLEMRQRYFELTGTSFREKERKLRLSQIIALRFAGDKELLPLIDRAIKEGMRSKEIKKSIENWQEDRRRV
ncbi:DUF6526 family protein [Cecembia calidifontis]|jgi:hypothetical protein|uniref:Uncharacterized protein n=1 Tax=Cecembia calidifontis TaxID=1187080 RepID=A0A4Q7PAZ7_9BACT|nr:DUF6526 family protein [Cecembia calidifontis]RZS97466.1 hypothetical protein BC751_3073 [Cecembia calidifontis]